MHHGRASKHANGCGGGGAADEVRSRGCRACDERASRVAWWLWWCMCSGWGAHGGWGGGGGGFSAREGGDHGRRGTGLALPPRRSLPTPPTADPPPPASRQPLGSPIRPPPPRPAPVQPLALDHIAAHCSERQVVFACQSSDIPLQLQERMGGSVAGSVGPYIRVRTAWLMPIKRPTVQQQPPVPPKPITHLWPNELQRKLSAVVHLRHSNPSHQGDCELGTTCRCTRTRTAVGAQRT